MSERVGLGLGGRIGRGAHWVVLGGDILVVTGWLWLQAGF